MLAQFLKPFSNLSCFLLDGSDVSPTKKKKTSVSRTESHQARFNSARAMFEKMGSADDLVSYYYL